MRSWCQSAGQWAHVSSAQLFMRRTEEMASCKVGLGFLLAEDPNIRFIIISGSEWWMCGCVFSQACTDLCVQVSISYPCTSSQKFQQICTKYWWLVVCFFCRFEALHRARNPKGSLGTLDVFSRVTDTFTRFIVWLIYPLRKCNKIQQTEPTMPTTFS